MSACAVLQPPEGWWILKSPTIIWSMVTSEGRLLAVADVWVKYRAVGGVGLVVEVVNVDIVLVMGGAI